MDLGGTGIAHQAIIDGSIDIYPDYTGDALANVRDMDAKGRRVSVPRFGPRDPAQVLRHERHPAAKLTAAQVRDIRSSMAKGTDLAQRYGIDKTTVSRVRRGQTWRGL